MGIAGATAYMSHLIFVGRRLLHAIPLLFAITIFSFAILHASRGDFADVMTGESGAADPVVMRELRHSLGLDRPAVSQLIDFVTRVFRFDLGTSFRYNVPVFDVISQRIFPTLLLTTTSGVIS